MVKGSPKDKIQTLSVDDAPVHSRNWRSHVKVRYFRTRNYVRGTKQKTITTGIMQSQNKQFRFNIWADETNFEPLEENQTYTIENVEKDNGGSLNFGTSSTINKKMDVEEPVENKVYSITELSGVNEPIMLDFKGHVSAMDMPYKWYNAQKNQEFTRQTMTVVDVIQRTSVIVTLWEHFHYSNVVGQMFLFKGFRLKIFKDSRAITSTVYSTYEDIKDFDVNKPVMESIEFRSISHIYKERTFAEVETLLHGKEDDEVFYTRKNVEIKKVMKDVPYYTGCSECCTKLSEDNYCEKCQKKVKPVVRLYFSLLIDDGETSLIAKFFHMDAEKLTNLAQLNLNMDLDKITPEQTSAQIQKLTGFKFRVGISSQVKKYQGDKYNNHTAHQIFSL